MKIKFSDFNMDQSIVAPIIYDKNRHFTTNRGVVISHEIRQELKRFLSDFNIAVGTEQTPYYRIDAYFNEDALWLIEINASFVDGWGTALNLARASGINVNPRLLAFPKKFASKSRLYLPELELFVLELAHLGLHDYEICDLIHHDIDPIYVYGRVGTKNEPHILPYDGLRLDNKLNLGVFSREWTSNLVKIPRHYISRFDSWENIPQEVVLKFCDKGSEECQRAGHSVLFNKPPGKAPFIKRCYNNETLIAQDVIQAAKQDENNCQLIIFAIGNEPITGYVQYSRNRIINDNSTHGPLQLN
jgi:hypothetical protein